MKAEDKHPLTDYVREDRMPHIWCSGCGLGTAMSSFVEAVKKAKLEADNLVIVSGIGCAGRVAGYLNFDSYHTTHGRAIPFALGLKLANPKLKVVVFSGDGDLFAIGGNHFIHAARRNIDMLVICVNNFNYGMTGGQVGPTTPLEARTTTTPYGNIEHPFNLPYLACASGAVYVARWTVLDARRLTNSIAEALNKKGFSFIEILAPCPTTYGKRNKLPTGLDELELYKKHAILKHGADTKEADIVIGKSIITGKFIDIEKPTFSEIYAEMVHKIKSAKIGEE
ncbi:MAG: 2-oxoacid:ferredoxin oxidoreductase subunit beta [Candidatus Thermoplasmatota archaeon]|nr:2-oxoacid:ferredoxin oxidoreductase subunit beta [Candidatus Thermoplasmatota archaeon]MDI6887388.1 2-oxoacid:ferredoxin oxidoreductase subunit beta [Candidatus Thermoplasmatota archaeon]